MSLIQKFIMATLPKAWAADIQADSENWLLICPNCGYVRSLWEIGGIRYKATPRAKKILVHCTQCGQNHFTMMERKQSS